MDATHKITRGVIQQFDNQTNKIRQSKNLIWGKSFERVRTDDAKRKIQSLET
jgi:hypothetical protein